MKRVFLIGLTMVLQIISHTAHARLSAYDLHSAWQKAAEQLPQARLSSEFPHMACFRAASQTSGVPLPLLLAVARGESDFQADARSPANAIGIMQIQWPGTAKHLGISDQQALYNPCVNIEAGARYLKELLSRYPDLNLALAAYNYGPGRITASSHWANLPEGAQWYSNYIYDHLQYVLKRPGIQYEPANKLTLAQFNQAFRAEAMKQYFQQQWPALAIDWFDNHLGQYRVVVSFNDARQRQAYLPQLRVLGFVE